MVKARKKERKNLLKNCWDCENSAKKFHFAVVS